MVETRKATHLTYQGTRYSSTRYYESKEESEEDQALDIGPITDSLVFLYAFLECKLLDKEWLNELESGNLCLVSKALPFHLGKQFKTAGTAMHRLFSAGLYVNNVPDSSLSDEDKTTLAAQLPHYVQVLMTELKHILPDRARLTSVHTVPNRSPITDFVDLRRPMMEQGGGVFLSVGFLDEENRPTTIRIGIGLKKYRFPILDLELEPTETCKEYKDPQVIRQEQYIRGIVLDLKTPTKFTFFNGKDTNCEMDLLTKSDGVMA